MNQLNSNYNPLGLAAPYTLKAKLLILEKWNLNESSPWHEHLPEQSTSEWLSLFEAFEMSEIDFRRCITPIQSVDDPMFVIFWDASKGDFEAAAYVVWTFLDGCNEAQLVLAKNRLAPKKQNFIVRLELCGVLRAVRLKKILFKHSQLTLTEVMYFVVDSKIVMTLTQKESYGCKTFTGVRLGGKQQTENPKSFYWCAGERNTADLISRGASPVVWDKTRIGNAVVSFLNLTRKNGIWSKKPKLV